MGQKVHPVGIRLGINRDWDSKMYAENDYAAFLASEIKGREFIKKKYKNASVSKVLFERPHKNAKVTVFAGRPGVIIGNKGKGIEELKTELAKIMGVPVHVSIEEVRKPELDAAIVAQNVAQQLENRVMFRRAMKRAVSNAMRLGAEGVKITVSGRLGGAEIARSEWYREGRVPLHTLRADIDYATGSAHTTYGVIGVKVWIFKGEVFEETPEEIEQAV